MKRMWSKEELENLIGNQIISNKITSKKIADNVNALGLLELYQHANGGLENYKNISILVVPQLVLDDGLVLSISNYDSSIHLDTPLCSNITIAYATADNEVVEIYLSGVFLDRDGESETLVFYKTINEDLEECNIRAPYPFDVYIFKID